MSDTEDRAIAAIEADDRRAATALAILAKQAGPVDWKSRASKQPTLGTHMGHLSPEARERRAKKNARANARSFPHGSGPRPRGAARWQTRLHLIGNAAKRGSNYAHH